VLQKKTLLATGLIALAIVIIVMRWDRRPDPRENLRWFYDLQSGELFTHDGNARPPVAAPSGGEGVLALVYSCGSCNDPSSRHVAYLEKMMTAESPDSSSGSDAMPSPSALMAAKEGRQLVARPDAPDDWTLKASVPGARMVDMTNRCPGESLEICLP
jgi:hypothetical protein